MGFRFRKSIKIIPGLRINLSSKGASVSAGGKGFTTTVSSRGVRNTVSLPGTGVSYTTYSKHPAPTATQPLANPGRRLHMPAVSLAVVIKTLGVVALIILTYKLFT